MGQSHIPGFVVELRISPELATSYCVNHNPSIPERPVEVTNRAQNLPYKLVDNYLIQCNRDGYVNPWNLPSVTDMSF